MAAAPAIFMHHHTLEKERVEEIVSTIEKLSGEKVETAVFKPKKSTISAESKLYTMIPDDLFAEWLEKIGNENLTIIVLPYEHNPFQQRSYAIPKKIEDAVSLAIAESPQTIASYIRCNEEPTIGCITIGKTEWVERPGIAETLRRVFSMRLRILHIKTTKEQEIKTAALMIEMGHEALLNRRRSYFFKASDNQCHRVAAVVYAPQSILGALKLRIFLANKKRDEADNLPPGIGTLKAESLTITSPENQPFPVEYNGRKIKLHELVVESVAMKAKVVTGETSCISGEEKESIRMQNLPTDNELISFFAKKPLPLVPIAEENAFAELFTKLRDAAKMKGAYLVLLLISVLMATMGLFQNSSPTIIGAMILAPLMGPIIAFAMGAIRFDEMLMRSSAKTVLLSTMIGLMASAYLAWVMPFIHLTDQMTMRTHPTLLDLAVAIFAGIAAAYGYANSKVGESLAGVAIAVALVPPLCVSGIGIGWGSWSLFANAFLLFLANIVGIVVASGAMFYLMGYASRTYASTAFVIKLMMVAVIAIPLWLSTRTLLAEEHIYSEFSQIEKVNLPDKTARIHLSKVYYRENELYAIVTITVDRSLTTEEKNFIANEIKGRLGENVRLVFNYREIY